MEKIVHIAIFERYCEGAGYQENLLAKKHKDLGYDVHIIASQESCDNKKQPIVIEAGNYVNNDGIHVYVLPSTHYPRKLSFFKNKCIGLYETLCSIKPNVIFVHNFTRRDVLQIVKYAKEHPEVRVFADCHSDYYNTPRNTPQLFIISTLVRFWAHCLNKVAIKFWGTIPWRVEYLQNVYKISKSKTDLLIMGADESYIEGRDRNLIRANLRKQYNIPEDAFLVVTGGILDRRKQQNLLMEAIKQMKSENVWLIAFGTPTKEMENIYEAYGREPNIILTGWLPSEMSYDLYMCSDLAFFPGTHSVLWEQAVACSIPLVVRRWHGMEHVNIDGNAIFMDEISVDNICKVIKELNNTEKYSLMKMSAERVASQFYLRNIAKKAIGLS